MSLPAGTRLGPYEIQSALGAGGMGEVYRARDTRLNRDVAIKVLPAGVAEPERLSRFEQEARAAAALNHPNILAIFDFGTHDAAPFIVTELLEGETLRARMDSGALPVRRAIGIAVEIARGLAAAHEKGIVHRDLKPENVFITSDERVKILDFGLAKLTQPAAAGSMMATGIPDTVPGMVMGTVGYMSPEQVRGGNADHRADIFALGAVLYEMLTGERAFRRETPAETMTAILREDPPPLTVAARPVPPALDRIVRRCLEKNSAARFQSALDLAFALEAADLESGSSMAVPFARPARTAWVPWAIAGLCLILAALGAAALFLRPAAAPGATRFNVLPPDGWRVDVSADVAIAAISPDGRMLALVARDAAQVPHLFVRPLDGLEWRVLPGTEGGRVPFWSPDSRWLGFAADGKLKRIQIAGGVPLTITDAPQGLSTAWGADDVIVFSQTGSGLQTVRATGGVPAPLTTLEPGEPAHGRPVFLPDGRRFLYSTSPGPDGMRRVYAATIGTPGRKLVLTTDSSNVLYAAGHLLLLRGTTLTAVPYDVDRAEVTGADIPLAEQLEVTQVTGRFGIFDVSDDVLVYRTTSTLSAHQLAWFDRSGIRTGLLGEPASHQSLEMIPGGTRVVLSILDPTQRTRDIWAFDLTRDIRTRLTFDRAEERSAVPSPDGREMIFNSFRTGALELYRKPSSGAGAETLLLEDRRSKDPMDWSPDGRYLLYRVTGDTGGNDIWMLPLSGDRTPMPLAATSFNENYARFSPDGRWIAYASDESGQVEVYVVPFPPGDGKWQVSTAGGSFPRWRGDGRELFYVGADGTLTAVAVAGSGGAFEAGRPQSLFKVALPVTPGYPYVATRDGQRFLINTDIAPPVPITVLTNWTATLPTTR
jgi:Tol biopolymer transport system component